MANVCSVPAIAAALMMLTVSPASGQTYPYKPIRIVTTGAGSVPDIVARLVALGLSPPLGQQVIIDNRSSGVIPGEIVSQAPSDGYTLLVAGGSFMLGPLLEKTPYDPVRNFAPITLVASSPNVLAINPSLPVKTVKDLIALAKAKPGELNYASAGVGGAAQLSTELFKSMAGGLNIVRINYKTIGIGLIDMMGGNVHMTIATAGAIMPQAKSGKLIALAVTSAEPSALTPGLPTVAASVPGYVAVGMTGLFAPANTPAPIVKRLNQELARALNTPEIKEKFLNSGAETVGNSPDAFAAAMKAEIARMGKVIKDAGIRAE